MMKIVMCKGLPSSGKSTWAKEMVRSNPSKWKRVNNDELTLMLSNKSRDKGTGKILDKLRESIIKICLDSGYSIIIDDTNLHPRHEINYKRLAEEYKIQFEIKEFPITVEEAIKRDLKRENSVGSKVIRQMYNQFLKKVDEEFPVYDKNLPDAIISDVDGTLAHIVTRGPFDTSKYSEDTVDETIKEIVNRYYAFGDKVIIVTGRDGAFKDATEKWLRDNEINYHLIYTRPVGDNRNDAIVKEEIYEREIKGKYNVRFVADDRNRVVEMWRRKGLKVLQVQDGDF